MQWTYKYRPKNPSQVVGREQEVRAVHQALQTKKPLLLAGPPGSGKTSLVYAIANDYEIIEVNASDSRNKASINEHIGSALKQGSLFMKQRLVLVDEVDGVSGSKDRGGVAALVKLIKETNTPIIFTANDGASDKLKTLRKVCTVITLDPLSTTNIKEQLQLIAQQEQLKLSEQTISILARRSGGDLRAAINDLQTIATTGDLELLGERNKTQAIEEGLLRVFKTKDERVAKSAYDDVSATPDEILLWVNENIAKEYKKPQDLARAYESLSKADVFLGRIRRQQYYRFYTHANALLSVGVAIAKEEKYPGMPHFTRSKKPLKIWIANNAQAKKKAIAEKIAEKTHASTRRVLQEFPYYLRACKNKNFLETFSQEFELDAEQITWLRQKSI